MDDFNACQKAFLAKLEIVQNLMSDIEGENKAISDYREHIGDLHDNFSAEPEARTLIKLLEEIEREEKHHLSELSAFVKNTIAFRMSKILDDYATCQCALREISPEARQQATIKIQGRHPHAR
jgi:hypothetical protein